MSVFYTFKGKMTKMSRSCDLSLALAVAKETEKAKSLVVFARSFGFEANIANIFNHANKINRVV